MTTREDLEFFEELGQKYPETEIVYATDSGRERRGFIREFMLNREGFWFLDLGCNDGHYAEHCRCVDYVGLDLSISLLKRARKSKQDAHFILGDACYLPFQTMRFDCVLLSEVFEHIEDKRSVFRESVRVLKINGELLVTVPYGNKTEMYIWRPILEKYGVRKRKYLSGRFTPEMLMEWFTWLRMGIIQKGIIGDHTTFVLGKRLY